MEHLLLWGFIVLVAGSFVVVNLKITREYRRKDAEITKRKEKLERLIGRSVDDDERN